MTKSPRAVCNSVKRLLDLRYENRERLLEYEVFFLEMIQCMCLPIYNMKHDPSKFFPVQHVKCCMCFEYICNGEIYSEATIMN